MNVHEAAGNGDPREVETESTCTLYIYALEYIFNEHILV